MKSEDDVAFLWIVVVVLLLAHLGQDHQDGLKLNRPSMFPTAKDL